MSVGGCVGALIVKSHVESESPAHWEIKPPAQNAGTAVGPPVLLLRSVVSTPAQLSESLTKCTTQFCSLVKIFGK